MWMEKLDEVVFLFRATTFFGHVLFNLNTPFPISVLGNFTYHDTRKKFHSLESLCQTYFQMLLSWHTAKCQWRWCWWQVTCLAELCQLCSYKFSAETVCPLEKSPAFFVVKKTSKYLINVIRNGLSWWGCTRQSKAVRNDLCKPQIVAAVCSVSGRPFSRWVLASLWGRKSPPHPSVLQQERWMLSNCQAGANSMFLKRWRGKQSEVSFEQHCKRQDCLPKAILANSTLVNNFSHVFALGFSVLGFFLASVVDSSQCQYSPLIFPLLSHHCVAARELPHCHLMSRQKLRPSMF